MWWLQEDNRNNKELNNLTKAGSKVIQQEALCSQMSSSYSTREIVLQYIFYAHFNTKVLCKSDKNNREITEKVEIGIRAVQV